MESSYVDNSSRSDRPTQQTTATSSPRTATTGMSSMFHNAQSIEITGGSFNITTNFNSVINGQSLDVLYKRVSPNAILNAGGRADEVGCHPGTREEVIGRIEKWGNGLATPMFWLSGPAGAGKSAIVQTIAERCNQNSVPHANFFFFRADSSRSDASPLVATLLHQILLLYPSLRDSVATLLSMNPLIFDSTLHNQLAQLIVAPLRSIQQSSSAYRPVILLIDGLDECDSQSQSSQRQILHAFDKVLAEQPCPIRLLVASRGESQIRMAFNDMTSPFLSVGLERRYSPAKDIRIFVNDQFKRVRKMHPLAHTLDATWPSITDVNDIIQKSSGQFIFAATVMRFIMESPESPALSLESVQGVRRLATKSPFFFMDAIYSHILSQVNDQEALKDILHAKFLIGKLEEVRDQQFEFVSKISLRMSLLELLELYNRKYTKAVVLSCLANLTSIARYASSDYTLYFHHSSSLSDYLLDQSRSGDYFVDISKFNYQILPVVWAFINNLQEPSGERLLSDLFTGIWFGLLSTSQLQGLPPGLMHMLATSERNIWSRIAPRQCSIFKSIYNLCICDEDVLQFRSIVRQWINHLHLGGINFDAVEHFDIPFSRRYFQMARADCYWGVVPDTEMAAALYTATDFDRHELASWLNESLHRIHKELWPLNIKRYTQLVKAWISWAVENAIPCDGLGDLPIVQQYIRRRMNERENEASGIA